VPPGVIELVRAGKTIAAIQEYRKATGAGLAEAKAAVDAIR
jgi:ribosomal protein L7/L12